MSKNVPKLRFPGFTGEWEDKKLGDMSDVRDGTHDSPKYVMRGYPLLTSKNLNQDGTLDMSNVSFISLEDYNKINLRSKVNKGDILFGMIGTIGNPVRVTNEGFAIKNVALIKEKTGMKRLMNDYLAHYFKSSPIDRQFMLEKAGNTQKFISLTKIRELKINFPSMKEQSKIGEFLSTIDSRITNQSSKLDSLQELKKGVMQKIFSQEIRFKREDGREYPDWEEKRLGDIAKITNGSGDVKDSNGSGLYPFFDRSTVIKYVDKYDFDNEAIIYPGEGAKFFPKYYVGKYGLHQRAYAIYNLDSNIASSKYLYYNLGTKNNYFLSTAVGTTVPSLRMSQFTDCKVEIPVVEEQTKIADFLSTLDSKISLESQILETFQTLKKGLLQQMFV